MENIETKYNDVVIKGVITFRDKWGISVEITYPFKNYYSGLNIPGIARQNPNIKHYLTEHGKKTAQYLLINMYKKLYKINKNLDRYIGIAKMRDQEIQEVTNNIKNKEIKARITSKLNQWFYNSTGLELSISDQELFEDAVKYYKENGDFKYKL